MQSLLGGFYLLKNECNSFNISYAGKKRFNLGELYDLKAAASSKFFKLILEEFQISEAISSTTTLNYMEYRRMEFSLMKDRGLFGTL